MHTPEKAPGHRDAMWRLALLALTLSAWLPMLRPYQRIADDFHFAEWLLEGGPARYFRESGIWRFAGHEALNGAVLAHPLAAPALELGLHAAGALLLLGVLRRVLASESLAVTLALVFAAYPWGITSVVWASASTYLMATTFFLALLWLLLAPVGEAAAVALCFAASAGSLLANEALFFALCIAGGLALFGPGASRARLPRAAAPLLACGLWALAYRIWHGVNPPQHIRPNPRTLLSGVWYQYTNVEIFAPWRSGSARALMFNGWRAWMIPAALVALALAGWAGWRAAGTRGKGEPAAARRVDMRLLVFLLVLLVGCVGVYAIGGGFSLDSRKKYPIIPVVLLFVGVGIEFFFPRVRVPRAVLALAAACGVATTWLHLGLWRYETARLALLADTLAAQPHPGAVRVTWDSRIQQAWPGANRFWGTPVEPWVVDNALTVRRLTAPPAPPSAPVDNLQFDPAHMRWTPAAGAGISP